MARTCIFRGELLYAFIGRFCTFYYTTYKWTSVKAVDSRTCKGDDCSYNKLASELHFGPVVIFLSNNGKDGHFVVVNQCTKAGGPLKASDFRVRDPGNGNGLMRLDTAMSYAKNSNIAQIESWGTGRGKSMPKP